MAEQLQHALHSRVTVEQAKGVLTARLHVDIGTAFELLRRYARNRNEHVADVAGRIIDGALPADQLLADARARRPTRNAWSAADRGARSDRARRSSAED